MKDHLGRCRGVNGCLVHQVGMVMEQHRKQITDGIYQAESLPPECDIMACSLDGVNVPTSEKGKRKGRPRERPHVDSNDLSGSSFENAMWINIVV